MNILRHFLSDFRSLFVGMGVTLRYMLHRPVTVLYPKEEIATPRFKGPIAFTTDELDSSHKCIACNACIKACPSRCMALKTDKDDKGRRVLTDFKVDYGLCSLCGICIEVCPTDALMHDSPNYDMVATSRGGLVNDLLRPFRDRGVNVNAPIMTPAQKKALYAAKAAPQSVGGQAAPATGGQAAAAEPKP